MEMTPRERMTRAVRRQRPDRVPKEVWLTPPVERLVRGRSGMDPLDFFEVEVRGVGLGPAPHQPDFSRYLARMPEGARINGEYGTAEVQGDFHHFTRRVFTLGDAASLRDLEEYPWPDFTSASRYSDLRRQVEELHRKGYFVDGAPGHIFETAWQLVGFEKLLEWMIGAPEMAATIIDRITEDNVRKAREFARAGVDMIRIADDVAMQDRMMMSPPMWREWFKARHARVVRAAREVNPEIAVWYHSDGAIEPVVEDLIEAGVTVLNPIQPECLDLAEIKRKYGDRLAFWGGIGTQSLMPFGTPEDVRRGVRGLIELLAPGLVIMPTHSLEPDVPWENILAFRDAVRDYGALTPRPV